MDEIYDQLKGIRCPSTIRQQGMDCTSCPDAIARVLKKVAGYVREEQAKGEAGRTPAPSGRTHIDYAPVPAEKDSQIPASSAAIHSCPECGGPVEHEGGCVICRSCGFSKCG